MDSGGRAKNPVGRPRRSGTEGGGDTRAQILDRAEALLTARGYAGMSMDDVARAAGLTKGTLYHHFPEGKDALILAVGHRSLERHGDALSSAILAARGARAQLEAVARWGLESSGSPARVLRDSGRFLPRAHAEDMARAFQTRVYGQVLGVLEGGARRGELPPHDPEFAAWALLGLVAEFAELQELLPRPRLAEQIVGLVLGGIGGE
ncbi:hypothetical protein DAETH_16310 [Deinococcus aetherius]|uniref:HTH tetR-type domain-containing protein n=1 Tax=Deinococcus aetherius TaxID=200252 RepID=A0ABN6RJB0_9DEIO|nr:TetR/AcrR family transcriptional regulator [Deinococcus aetherius]BDP41662.1 hypothetical protein DAETH_16310 [Deinococcus aetherius]